MYIYRPDLHSMQKAVGVAHCRTADPGPVIVNRCCCMQHFKSLSAAVVWYSHCFCCTTPRQVTSAAEPDWAGNALHYVALRRHQRVPRRGLLGLLTRQMHLASSCPPHRHMLSRTDVSQLHSPTEAATFMTQHTSNVDLLTGKIVTLEDRKSRPASYSTVLANLAGLDN